MRHKIIPFCYPVCWVKRRTIGVCDVGDVEEQDNLETLLRILTHEYLHILLCNFVSITADRGFDNLNNIEGSY